MAKIEIVEKARIFATKAHAGQKRKYTGEDYITHPTEVVEILRGVPRTPEMLAAGWLHDVVEDCGVQIATIGEEFGLRVRYLVDLLSDPAGLKGNRAARKAQIVERWRLAPPNADDARTIKLADIISNTNSIFSHDPNFAKTYFREIHSLLPCLEDGDVSLLRRARGQLEEYSGIIH